MRKGFIVKANAGLFDVYNGEEIVQTRARGKFRIGKYVPLVGDYVSYDEKQNYLMEIFDRKNELTRPPLANVECVGIIASVANPRISLSLINRYIVMSEIIGVKPFVILTKIDICEDDYANEVKNELTKMGYDCLSYSSKSLEGVEEIKKYIKGKKLVFTGQSGCGKSTLINILIPGTRQKTNEISNALNRGKHTTRVCEYIKYEESWIADTPGFSSMEFELNPVDIAAFYPGFDKYYSKCKFRNCLHEHEKGCAVKDAVEKGEINPQLYDDYLSLLNDIKNKKVF